MKRSEVKDKLVLVNEAIAKIEKNDDVVLYITKDKHLPGVGYVCEIDTIADVINAHTKISKLGTDGSDYLASARTLGLSETEFPMPETKIQGFAQTHWFKDLNTRLAELQTSIKLEKLIAAKKVLNKHLSDDDKFDLDTVGIDELI